MFTQSVKFCFTTKEQKDDSGTNKGKLTTCFCTKVNFWQGVQLGFGDSAVGTPCVLMFKHRRSFLYRLLMLTSLIFFQSQACRGIKSAFVYTRIIIPIALPCFRLCYLTSAMVEGRHMRGKCSNVAQKHLRMKF